MEIRIVIVFWESSLAVSVKNTHSSKNSHFWNLSHAKKSTACKDIWEKDIYCSIVCTAIKWEESACSSQYNG